MTKWCLCYVTFLTKVNIFNIGHNQLEQQFIQNVFKKLDPIIDIDFQEAVKWFEFASNNGNSKATYYLGCCYYDGDGVPENEARALELLRDAAKNGEDDALSTLHELGFDLDQAPITASPEVDENGIIKIYDDPVSKAKSLLRKMTDQVNTTKQHENIDNVIVVAHQRTERLEGLMMADESDAARNPVDWRIPSGLPIKR